jgi:hypothetical protein
MAVGALALAGCGASVQVPSISFPTTTPSAAGADTGGGGADSATFHFPDGGTISVQQSGRATISGYGDALDHDGPLGCRGRYFTGDYTDDIRMLFHYTAHHADLGIGTHAVYHFKGAPTRVGHSLTWSHHFPDGTYGVTVRCSRPGKGRRR